jgi:hypothetical protein
MGRRLRITPGVMRAEDRRALRDALAPYLEPAQREGQAEIGSAGRRRNRTSGIEAIVVLGLLFALGLGFTLKGCDGLIKTRRLDERGKMRIGRVTSSEEHQSRGNSYYLHFAFWIQGREFFGSSPVAESDYRNMRPGHHIRVIYDPGDPQLCRAEQSISGHGDKSRIIVGLITMALSASTLALNAAARWRRRASSRV